MSQPAQRLRFPLLAAGVFGLIGIALGAMGAHALAAELAKRGTAHAWQTAAHYHVFHAVALLAAAGWLRGGALSSGTGSVIWAARLWSAGIVLFSGSLYWLALGGPPWLGPITPLGGIAFMGGWVMVAVAALRKETSEPELR